MINKAISVRQPWAEAIIRGGKNVENRSWMTKYRGLIAIHAGMATDDSVFFEFVTRQGILGTLPV